MIKCPSCGAELKYKVEDKNVICEYCGGKFNPKELKVKVQTSEEHKKQEVQEKIDPNNCFEGMSYTCSQCGATLLTFDETAITFCSYCGSQAMIESKMIKINKPDYIIPFKVTKEECINNYKKKLRKAFFAPNYMKSDIVVSKFRGIYLPYGVYRLTYNGKFSNSGSKRSHRKGDYVYYDDYNIVSNTDTEYEGISFDLLSIFYDKYSFSIPFDYKECEEFNPNYLAGFYADTKDVSADSYDDIVKDIVRRDCSRILQKEKKYKVYGCYDPKLPITVSKRKVGMFPVYFLAIRDKQEKHVNYAVINGQNGKVAASLPLDFKKYLLLTLIISVISYFIIDKVGLLLLPRAIVFFSIVASLISLIVSNNQLRKLDINKKHLDDLGYMTKNNNMKNYISNDYFSSNDNSNGPDKVSTIFLFLVILLFIFMFIIFVGNYLILLLMFIPFIVPIAGFVIISKIIRAFDHKKKSKNKKEKKMKYLYKQIIAMIIGAIILILKPVDDVYYYSAAIMSFVLTIISFYDIFKEHNEIVSNRLPQLEIRGGDERE